MTRTMAVMVVVAYDDHDLSHSEVIMAIWDAARGGLPKVREELGLDDSALRVMEGSDDG